MPKVRELILGDLVKTQPPDSQSVAASPTAGPFPPGMDDPMLRPLLLQAVGVFDWPNWQESQEDLAVVSEGRPTAGSWAGFALSREDLYVKDSAEKQVQVCYVY